MGETKTCIKCGKEKPLTIEHFRQMNNRFRGNCRTCEVEYAKKYAKNNKDKVRKWNKKQREGEDKNKVAQYHKQYYINNKEKHAEYGKRWARNNPEARKKHLKKYYDNNKEMIAIRIKQFYKNNPESRVASTKKWNDANPEHGKKWRKNNPERYKEQSITYRQRRRARKKQLPHTLNAEQWESCKKYFNNVCCYCGNERILTQDHFIALNNDGEYTLNNIAPACLSCNSSKHDKDFFKWYPRHSFYSKKREQKILKYLNYNPKEKTQQLALSM